ncbi:hypothetical protein LY90DRAFT_519390, partial [Neocallimastix californiae]
MKILELQRILPRLNENARDIDSWCEEFTRIMSLADINNPKNILTWAIECVDGKLKGTLQELHTKNEEENDTYPSIEEIKKAIENELEITPQEKCKRLQRMKIRRGESIKNFNWRYKKIYNNLPKIYQTFITVEDYADSIIYRPYARSQVITQRCFDLEDAFEEAELAERAEEIGDAANEAVMTTVFNSQPFYYRNNVHPFKQFNSSIYNKNYNQSYNQNHNQIIHGFSNPKIANNKRTYNQEEYEQKNNLVNIKQNFDDTRLNNEFTNNETNQNRKKIITKKSPITCYRCGQQGHYYKHWRRETPTNQTKEEIVATAIRKKTNLLIEKPYGKNKRKNKENNTINQNNQIDSNTKTNNENIEIEDDAVSIDKIYPNETEKLNQIDVSVISQPSINKAKKNARKQRENEILNINNKETNKHKEKAKLPSIELAEKKVKNSNFNKQITIMEGQPKYDICKDISSKFANITVPQLLDVSPKLRADFIKALKLKSPETLNESPEEIVLSAMHREDVATVECFINDIKGLAFLDTCASINIITKNFLNKLNKIKPIGFVKNNIVQVLSKENVYTEIYLLNVKIGKLVIHDIFRVIDNDQNLFDILIGYRTLKENNLFINPLNNNLCLMKEDDSWEYIIKLGKGNNGNIINNNDDDAESIIIYDETNSDINNNSYLYCFIKEDNSKKNNTILKEPINTKNSNLETGNEKIKKQFNEEINEKDKMIEVIINGVPNKFKNKIKEIFNEFYSILATKIDELKPTKLLPHNIQLEMNTKPIKQKCYRLSKVQAIALKKELEKLIKNKLIEPSNSPWSSPVILVLKKNKKWRL